MLLLLILSKREFIEHKLKIHIPELNSEDVVALDRYLNEQERYRRYKRYKWTSPDKLSHSSCDTKGKEDKQNGEL